MQFLVIITTSLLLLWMLVWLRYRLISGEKITGETVLIYRMIDLGQKDFYRYSFESVMGNKRVFIKHTLNEYEWLYLRKSDFEKLHPESPLSMSENDYTIQFKYETKKLLLGGLGLARITTCKKINESPEVYKS